MRRPDALAYEQVPEIPEGVHGEPSGTTGDVIFNSGVHRWRKDKDGKLLYYVRYANEQRDRQEAAYSAPGRR